MGAELEKGRNLLAETSGGQIRKGPKPLATLQPHPPKILQSYSG